MKMYVITITENENNHKNEPTNTREQCRADFAIHAADMWRVMCDHLLDLTSQLRDKDWGIISNLN